MLKGRCDKCNNWELCIHYAECTRERFQKKTTDNPEMHHEPGKLNDKVSNLKPDSDSMLEFWKLHLRGEA